MSLKSSLVRMFGAAIVFAALCAAPSMANAHAGHAAPPAASGQSSVIAPDEVQADVHAPDEAGAQVVSAPDLRSAKTDQNGCGGLLCCGNAPCAACAFVIAVDTSMTLPPWVSAVVLFPDSAPGASIGPQELSRPPRSFV